MNPRNSWLDLLKFIGIFAVVVIHVGPFYHLDDLKPVGVLINNIMRFAVPCFFMCTGYFLNSDASLFNKYDNVRIKKNIKKLIVVFFIWNVIYYFLMPQNFHFTLNTIILGTAPHLWFLSALIQCLLLKYFFNVIFDRITISRKLVFSLSLSFFLIFYYYFKYCFSDSIYIKSILCVFVFYIYGAIIRCSTNMQKPISVALIFLGVILQLSESFLAWKYLSLSPTIDFNFGTLLFSVGVFNLFLIQKSTCSKLANFGKDSLGVYLIHYYIIILINKLNLDYDVINDILKIFLVFIISYAFTMFIKKIKYFKLLVGA
ncbi:acyltransferase [Klebsiella oxytoca]|uniref:acyltransferase n=1 Tax=Klebsiella oxytoca TaxID=571 RepID=UPI00189D575C